MQPEGKESSRCRSPCSPTHNPLPAERRRYGVARDTLSRNANSAGMLFAIVLGLLALRASPRCGRVSMSLLTSSDSLDDSRILVTEKMSSASCSAAPAVHLMQDGLDALASSAWRAPDPAAGDLLKPHAAHGTRFVPEYAVSMTMAITRPSKPGDWGLASPGGKYVGTELAKSFLESGSLVVGSLPRGGRQAAGGAAILDAGVSGGDQSAARQRPQPGCSPGPVVPRPGAEAIRRVPPCAAIRSDTFARPCAAWRADST